MTHLLCTPPPWFPSPVRPKSTKKKREKASSLPRRPFPPQRDRPPSCLSQLFERGNFSRERLWLARAIDCKHLMANENRVSRKGEDGKSSASQIRVWNTGLQLEESSKVRGSSEFYLVPSKTQLTGRPTFRWDFVKKIAAPLSSCCSPLRPPRTQPKPRMEDEEAELSLLADLVHIEIGRREKRPHCNRCWCVTSTAVCNTTLNFVRTTKNWPWSWCF